MPESIRLYTLGRLALEADGAPVSGAAAQRRRLGLLGLLAVAGEAGLTRDKLVGYFWAEQPISNARHLLSEAVYVLRRVLGEDGFVTGQDDVRLNRALVWSDVAAFEDRLSAGDDVAAAVLYAGPFLDGFFLSDAPEFERWVDGVREDLAQRYARALERIAERATDARAAAEAWARAAAHDPYSSRVALRFMEALAAAGDRARALRHAAVYTTRLREDLGLEPDPAVVALSARLRADPGDVAPPPPAAAPSLAVTPEAPPATSPSAETFPADLDAVRLLGEGAVARVYLAREPALGRLVAVKVLRQELAGDETARRRFEREAQSAARIQHPNVATVFRVGRLPSGTPYLVLPYIAGGSLEDRLAGAGPMAVPEARRHIAQLASALAAAHRLGIVHRDVRPGNILYDHELERLLLTDFGVAAVLETGDARSLRLTRPGEVLGDPSYASPEQLRGEPVTERADVYSLGVVAFQMLTGELPFLAASPLEMMAAHARAEPRRVSELRPDVDPALDALIRRCLNKRAEQRPYAGEVGAV